MLARQPWRCCHHRPGVAGTLAAGPASGPNGRMTGGQISVFLADDNLIVREGVRAMLALEPDIEVVGMACDYDDLVAQAGAASWCCPNTTTRSTPSRC